MSFVEDALRLPLPSTPRVATPATPPTQEPDLVKKPRFSSLRRMFESHLHPLSRAAVATPGVTDPAISPCSSSTAAQHGTGVSLTLDGHLWVDLPRQAPALLLLLLQQPSLAQDLTAANLAASTRMACAYLRDRTQPDSRVPSGISDDSLLKDLDGADLDMRHAVPPTVRVPLLVHDPDSPSSDHTWTTTLPTAWTLSDLSQWCANRSLGDPAPGGLLLMAGSVPAPADLSFKSPCTTLVAVRGTAAPFGRWPIKLLLHTLKGKTFQVSIPLHATLEHLKQAVQDEEGNPPEQQRITFEGRHLSEDWRSLSGYGVQDGSHLYVILNLRGC